MSEKTPRELVHVERGVDGDTVVREVWTESGRGVIVVGGLGVPRIEVTTGCDANLTADEAETLASPLMWAARLARGEAIDEHA